MGVGIGEAFDDFPNLRLVVDVSDVQNCCQEDDLVSSIALLGFTLHRLKIITQNPRPFHSVEEMFVFDSSVALLILLWNSDFERSI